LNDETGPKAGSEGRGNVEEIVADVTDRIRAYQRAARKIATSDLDFGDRVLRLATLREHAFGEVLDDIPRGLCITAIHVGARPMFAPPDAEEPPFTVAVEHRLRQLVQGGGESSCTRCYRELPQPRSFERWDAWRERQREELEREGRVYGT
jgi:hypothetical protein